MQKCQSVPAEAFASPRAPWLTEASQDPAPNSPSRSALYSSRMWNSQSIRDVMGSSPVESPPERHQATRSISPNSSLCTTPRSARITCHSARMQGSESMRDLLSPHSAGASSNMFSPGSPAVIMERCRSQSPNSARDHFWELHDPEEQRAPRLRGASSKANAQHNKASAGIPWRRLPHGSGADTPLSDCSMEPVAMQAAGGHNSMATAERQQQRGPIPFRKKGQFSPRWSSSQGVQELLATVDEHARLPIEKEAAGNDSASASPAAATDPGQNVKDEWLSVVRRRLQYKLGVNEKAEKAPPESARSGELHWTHRSLRKKVGQDFETKESCPYFREDVTPESKAVQAPPSGVTAWDTVGGVGFTKEPGAGRGPANLQRGGSSRARRRALRGGEGR